MRPLNRENTSVADAGMCRRTTHWRPQAIILLTIGTAFLTPSAQQPVRSQHHKQTIATSRRIQSSHKGRASGSGGGLHPAHAPVPKQFIYVYDMPAEFTEDVKELPLQWHPEQYDYDQVLSRSCLARQVYASYEEKNKAILMYRTFTSLEV